MLDIDNCTSLVDKAWSEAELKTQLPADWTDFFEQQGPAPVAFDNLRSYHRFFLRNKAVIASGEKRLASYTKDVSRIGMGLLTPTQLFPRQVIRVWLPEGRDYLMSVMRCLRIRENCYECGAVFLRITEAQPDNFGLPETLD